MLRVAILRARVSTTYTYGGPSTGAIPVDWRHKFKLLKISLSNATPWPCPMWHEEMREKPNCSAIDEKTGMVTLSLRPKCTISSVSVATTAPMAAASVGGLRLRANLTLTLT